METTTDKINLKVRFNRKSFYLVTKNDVTRRHDFKKFEGCVIRDIVSLDKCECCGKPIVDLLDGSQVDFGTTDVVFSEVE